MLLSDFYLAEKTTFLERHWQRVEQCLPQLESESVLFSSASDSVILHLFQAIQIVIDMATSACIHLKLGTPTSYADAFIKLGTAGYISNDLAVRLSHAAGFRNRIVHAYEKLDMAKVYQIAKKGPDDLRQFLGAAKKWIS